MLQFQMLRGLFQEMIRYWHKADIPKRADEVID
jgi:hypothetical protein